MLYQYPTRDFKVKILKIVRITYYNNHYMQSKGENTIYTQSDILWINMNLFFTKNGTYISYIIASQLKKSLQVHLFTINLLIYAPTPQGFGNKKKTIQTSGRSWSIIPSIIVQNKQSNTYSNSVYSSWYTLYIIPTTILDIPTNLLIYLTLQR